MTTTVKPIPEGRHSLTPQLVCAGAAAAIEFYKAAFGAVELTRLPGKSGKLMHGSVRIGDSVLMLVDEMPEWGARAHLAERLAGDDPPLRRRCRCRGGEGGGGRRDDHDAGCGHVLGRPLWHRQRPVRPPMVARDPHARSDARADPGGDGGDGRLMPLPRLAFRAQRSAAKTCPGRLPRFAEAVFASLRLPCDARSRGPSLNSRRSLRSLCSNRRDESVDEARCARGHEPCASRRSRGALQPARTRLC